MTLRCTETEALAKRMQSTLQARSADTALGGTIVRAARKPEVRTAAKKVSRLREYSCAIFARRGEQVVKRRMIDIDEMLFLGRSAEDEVLIPTVVVGRDAPHAACRDALQSFLVVCLIRRQADCDISPILVRGIQSQDSRYQVDC